MRPTTRLLATAATAAIALVACSGSDDDGDAAAPETAAPPVEAAAEETADAPAVVEGGPLEADFSNLCGLLPLADVETELGAAPATELISGSIDYGANCNYETPDGGPRIRLSVVDFDQSDLELESTTAFDANLAFLDDSEIAYVEVSGIADRAVRYDGFDGPSTDGGQTTIDLISGNRVISIIAENGTDGDAIERLARTVLDNIDA